jgi:arsenate reductase-like glutaredoxin family protein
VKARGVLAQTIDPDDLQVRNLIKEPLTEPELRALAKQVGGPEQLVAPKRRAEAEGLAGKDLFAWLAADGGHVRRPIIATDKGVIVGFAADAKARLPTIL